MNAFFNQQEVLAATGGQLQQVGADNLYAGVSTDSRTAQAGEIFIPLLGEKFDGHQFLGQALGRGVRCLVLDESWWRHSSPVLSTEVTVLTVRDTLHALGDLAQAWRRRFSTPVVTVTGSCGKTSTKEMAAQVAATRYRVLKNDMNLNNLIGMPQTLLQMDAHYEVAIVEMGMNRFGEIRRLAQIAEPNIGVLTNIYPAHTAGLGDVEGVARAKGELLEVLGKDDLLIYNRDDARLAKMAQNFSGGQLSFGLTESADLFPRNHCCRGLKGQEFDFCYQGQCWPVSLQSLGLHHLYNSLAAAAIGLSLGLTPSQVAAGLAGFVSLDKRAQVLTLGNGVSIINDSYNANPGSMGMALQALAACRTQGRLLAALGDMLELGEATEPAHRQLGAKAAQLNLDLLIICGEFRDQVTAGALQAGMPAHKLFPVPSLREGAQILKDYLKSGDCLLVKGSRGMRMEKLVEELK
jgi:UDP-N-acetylmuramoyl-tripeptide--D-alanyl-D-alanine ligase